MTKALLGALAMTIGAITLPACESEPEAPAEANPEAPAGVAVSEGRMNLPAVAGNPAAVYFTVENDGDRTRMLRAVSVQGAGMTMLHQTTEWNRQVAMQEVTQIPIPAGGELKLEPGGQHVMAMELDDSLQAGGETEATVTFTGGDKVSFPLRIMDPGGGIELLALPAPCPVGGERPLTKGEIALARTMFGDAIDYAPVTIKRRKFFPFQPRRVTMAPRGHIHFHPGAEAYCDDFAAAPLSRQSLFIHEMTHVWQTQRLGGWYLVLHRHPWCRYDYSLRPGWPLERYGIEQQAEIVRHAFLVRNGFSLKGVASAAAYDLLVDFPGAARRSA